MQPRFNIYYKEYGSSLCELWSATDTTRAFNRVSKRIRSPRKISSPLNVSLQSFRPFCSNNILRQIRFPSFLLYSFSSPPRERKARRKCNELTQLLYKYIRRGAGHWKRAKIGNERNHLLWNLGSSKLFSTKKEPQDFAFRGGSAHLPLVINPWRGQHHDFHEIPRQPRPRMALSSAKCLFNFPNFPIFANERSKTIKNFTEKRKDQNY